MEVAGLASRNCLKFLQITQPGLLNIAGKSAYNLQFFRHRKTKHFIPKWKKLRAQKFVKIDLPNYQEKPEDLSKEEIRSRLKEKGVLPPRPWLERPFYLSATGGIFEPYVPPEGDGKSSLLSKAGAKQKLQLLEKKSKSMMAVRKIRNYEEDFATDEFAQAAQDIYVKAHKSMCSKDKQAMHELVTERAYPEMIHNIKDKTIRWQFLKSLEPPKVVHARVTDIISKENLFAQVTVRFHTQQTLAIYDRFGRLIHGSEILAKDVLEYVVFEKHISNEYGVWRLHDKIIPDWMPPKEPGPITYRFEEEAKPEVEAIEATEKKEIEATEKKEIEAIEGGVEVQKEKLVTA